MIKLTNNLKCRRFAIIKRVLILGPKFIDFTWGAGGATSDTTLRLCKSAKEMGFEVNMHLTCTNMDIEKVRLRDTK